MTKVKLCGLSRRSDIETANALQPDYIGFVFAPKSRRFVSPEQAASLKAQLSPAIQSVGVFVNETPETVAALLSQGVIDLAQLHGSEDETYISALRAQTDKPIIQAFRIDCAEDVDNAQSSTADFVLLDAGTGGTGTQFDWSLLSGIRRPYFLAGGLSPENVAQAIHALRPYAVDVSSGIETHGFKDPQKMTDFIRAVRGAD